MSIITWPLQIHKDFSDLSDNQIATNRFHYVTYQVSHMYPENTHMSAYICIEQLHDKRLFLLNKGLLLAFFPRKKVYNG